MLASYGSERDAGCSERDRSVSFRPFILVVVIVVVVQKLEYRREDGMYERCGTRTARGGDFKGEARQAVRRSGCRGNVLCF